MVFAVSKEMSINRSVEDVLSHMRSELGVVIANDLAGDIDSSQAVDWACGEMIEEMERMSYRHGRHGRRIQHQ